MSEADEVVARNLRQQSEWYGEPLGERIGRLRDALAISQRSLAGVLGLSAPMLSQLMSGNRAKISNPAVLTRLLAAESLVNDPSFAQLPAQAVQDKLTEISSESLPTSTMISVARGDQRGETDVAGAVQALLRELASAAEIEAAAQAVEQHHAELAEFLRTYGAGKSTDARAHYERYTRG